MKPYLPGCETLPDQGLCILGLPFDANSSYRRGPALAPSRIRECYASDSSNLSTETGTDLRAVQNLHDLGDLDCTDPARAFSSISQEVSRLIRAGNRLICLGGDHSVTFPVIQGFAKTFKDLSILHLDAHPDLYHALDGNLLSHGSPFARIMEKGLAKRLVQAGIRTMTPHQRDQVQRFGVEVHEMKDGLAFLDHLSFDGPVYLSIDLDCLDPAFAPGVSHHEPGGFSTREVLDILHRFKGRLVGADIVEYNPDRDFISMTGMVAAKLLKEVLGRMIST